MKIRIWSNNKKKYRDFEGENMLEIKEKATHLIQQDGWGAGKIEPIEVGGIEG